MKSGLFRSSEISTPVVLNAQSCVVAAVSPTRAISTSTAYQILSLMICQAGGEWGVGNGEWGGDRSVAYPTPHSLLPTPLRLSLPFFNTKFVERGRVVPPMFLDADEEMEPDVASEQIFDVAPGFHAYLFQSLPALADDDRFLRLALNVDHAMYFGRPLHLLPHFGSDGGGEGKLLRREFQNLLADQFRRDVAFDLVGENLGVVKPLAFGQALEQLFDQRLVVVACGCGDRNDLGEVILLAVLFDHRQQSGFVLQEVDLVQQEEGWFRGLFNQVESEAVARAEAGCGVAHQQNDVDLL